MNVSEILSAVDTALGVIKAVAETPGISASPYASTVSNAVSAISIALAAGKNVAPYVVALSDTFSTGLPSQEQLDALDAKIDELRAQVQAPLPPKEDGEPD